MKLDFYPRPPRGGRREKALFQQILNGISIHALREEGDRCSLPPGPYNREKFLSTPSARRATRRSHQGLKKIHISIHALREEGDWLCPIFIVFVQKFLSTPSARRATNHCPRPCVRHRYFYPRPPRGGRLDWLDAFQKGEDISIHALREEGD